MCLAVVKVHPTKAVILVYLCLLAVSLNKLSDICNSALVECLDVIPIQLQCMCKLLQWNLYNADTIGAI